MHGTRGFSLLEAMVAVSLLALGCTVLTAVLVAALRAHDSGDARREAAEALGHEAQRLAALPYCTTGGAPGPAGGPDSVLREVFPHARQALNTATAFCEQDAANGGVRFVSETTGGGYSIRRTARFCVVAGGTKTWVGAAALDDWAEWETPVPPSAAGRLGIARAGRRPHQRPMTGCRAPGPRRAGALVYPDAMAAEAVPAGQTS